MEPVEFIYAEDGGVDYKKTLGVVMAKINEHEGRWKQFEERERKVLEAIDTD